MKSCLLPLLLVACGLPCIASSVTITTKTLPNGTVSAGYAATVKASGGCTPYKWSIAAGALPAGVTSKASGAMALSLSGTPTKAASYSFTVKVSGCGGAISEESYHVAIQAASEHVVDLNWNASTSADVVGYNVYRSPDKATWKRVNAGTVASTLYDDSTVASSTTYYYSVTAVDTSGVESGKTPPVKVVVP